MHLTKRVFTLVSILFPSERDSLKERETDTLTSYCSK